VKIKGSQVIDILVLHIPVDIFIIDIYRTEIFQRKRAFKNYYTKYISSKRITKYSRVRVGKT
jgi:hypothetical protein